MKRHEKESIFADGTEKGVACICFARFSAAFGRQLRLGLGEIYHSWCWMPQSGADFERRAAKSDGLFMNLAPEVAAIERQFDDLRGALKCFGKPLLPGGIWIGFDPARLGYFAVLNGAIPARANSSARSFSAWPAWPLIQRQVT